MGLSFKLAPGVRLRVNKRGLGASVGPRIARTHFNPGGRVGFSSGAGPLTISTSAGGHRRHGTSVTPARPLTVPAHQPYAAAVNPATAYFIDWCDQRAGRLPGVGPLPTPAVDSLPYIVLAEPDVPVDHSTSWLLFALGFPTLGITWIALAIWYPCEVLNVRGKRERVRLVFDGYRRELAGLASWYGTPGSPRAGITPGQ